MEYKLTDKKVKNIKPEIIFKLDTLEDHFNHCISTIIPIAETIDIFKHLYEPCNITDYYGRMKRNYEAKLCAWKNRQGLWKN